MRKLKLQVQLTVDGYHSGPNGELNWMNFNWDEKLIDYVNKLTDSCDTILLGRKMTDGFVNYWEGVLKTSESPEYDFARKMVNTPKIVFTKTLEKSPWNNTKIEKGDLKEEVNKLKGLNGKDIIVYGGTSFVAKLIKEGLIDEYHLFINPAVIGNGKTIFGELDKTRSLALKNTIAFKNGIVMNHYEPVK
ncbi:MAG TPA: dihydrofolate reductase family protein [Ignavibacteria bacterium]|jgi:dihydrofolate reductase